jgi:hypothetical protein
MGRVRWEDLQRTPLYEDMVAVVLSRLHPGAERIDGVGGDGGRDVQLRTPGRLDIFELKSFTGRLGARSPNRRRQVEESLQTAAGLQPDSWTLVVPIDHNTDELAWFDGLRHQYPFPLTWSGRTWLDDQMIKFPEVPRYYLEGAKDEVVDLLRELNAEQSALAGGVEDAVSRLSRLRSRLNEIDPQFRFELTPGTAEVAMSAFPGAAMYSQRPTETGPISISVIPKYRDALRDRPIRINATFAFPDTEIGHVAAEKFRAFIDYGDETVVSDEHVEGVDIDAPGGLGGQLGPGMLRFSPQESGFQIDARLRISDQNNAQIASLPVRVTRGRRGQRGVTVVGHDLTGIFHLSMRFDEVTQRVKLDLSVGSVSGQMPAALLAPLRLAHALRSPNLLTITMDGVEAWTPTPVPDLGLVSVEYLEFVEQLARVQLETNTPFSIPDEVTSEDVATLRRTVRLFDGDPIALDGESLQMWVNPDSPRPWLESGNQGNIAVESVFTETFMNEEIPLGICNVVMGPVGFQAEVDEGADGPDAKLHIRVVPTPETRAFLRRGPLPVAE